MSFCTSQCEIKTKINLLYLIQDGTGIVLYTACTQCYGFFVSLSQAGLLSRIQEIFNCIVCQEVVYQPVTTTCSHNICKLGNQRSLMHCLISTCIVYIYNYMCGFIME